MCAEKEDRLSCLPVIYCTGYGREVGRLVRNPRHFVIHVDLGIQELLRGRYEYRLQATYVPALYSIKRGDGGGEATGTYSLCK